MMHGPINIKKNLKCFDSFSKNTRPSNFMKIRLVRPALFHANGRKDGHEVAISRFLQFCEKHLKVVVYCKNTTKPK